MMSTDVVGFATSLSAESLWVLAMTGFCIALASRALFLHWGGVKSFQSSQSSSTTVAASKPRKREITKCPFSREVQFVQEAAEHLPPTPLDLYESWKDHLATRWLAAGLSGQDTPGYLRAGLKRLRHNRHFLVEEPHMIKQELLLKKKHMDNPESRKIRLVTEQESLDAQWETLELVVGYLPDRYPDLYTYNHHDRSITVHPIETTFKIDEWKDRPLELCERMVQEDLVLMRPGPAMEDNKHDSHGYYMSAAAVCFSFNELVKKLSKPVEFIHAPVPGYEQHLRKTMNMMFAKLKPEAPLWRNNWGIAPTGTLDEPLYGSEEAHNDRKLKKDVTVDDVKGMFLKVEYQTIRRLPRTGYLLFTIKTMVDQLDGLEKVPPKAAQCLAASIRGMSREMRAYKGITDDTSCEAILKYLDTIEAKSQ